MLAGASPHLLTNWQTSCHHNLRRLPRPHPRTEPTEYIQPAHGFTS